MNRESVLTFPGLLNVRDLGAHPTVDGELTRRRSLLRADDLAQLTPEGARRLTEFGLKTVLDLRWPEELLAAPNPLAGRPGIDYHTVSLLAANPEEWRDLSSGYPKEQWNCLVLKYLRPRVREVLAVIAAADPGPLIFHCVAGKDRTGLVAALLLTLARVQPAAIAADYAASSECLRDAYLQRNAEADPADIIEAVRCPPEGIYNMLAYLAAEGGIVSYLVSLGLQPGQITRLHARLRES